MVYIPTLIFLTILNFHLSIRFAEAVLRNDITDRCLHLDSTAYVSKSLNTGRSGKADNSVSVYARTCSWDSTPKDTKTTKSNPNEWLEIVPTGFQQESFIIRKIEENETCLSSVQGQPMATNSCSKPATEFKIDRVNQNNFKGPITSVVSFKIRNREGQCLTVQPGTAILRFKECSPRAGLFQVWTVCRHTRQCDVDLTWTAREIIFPTNASNSSTTAPIIESSTKPTSVVNALYTQIKSSCTEKNNVILNEVLYSVQNALRIFHRSDDFIISTLSVFYPFNTLLEASSILANLCQDQDSHTSCNACKTMSLSSPIKITDWLIRWMSECNAQPYAKVFMSSDILQIPLSLFPIQEAGQLHQENGKSQKQGQEMENAPTKHEQIVGASNKVNVTQTVENTTDTHPTTSENPKSELINVSGEQNWNSSELNGSHQNHDILSLIDVRIIQSKPSRKINSTRQVE
ncbi:unnamed protein product [Orchesella dallaii]|uniref:Uncharacterized protein n=1 Tax=Orchesella dallaii TaxID=48710 RepID=A0ABP1Q1T6_9HEXA